MSGIWRRLSDLSLTIYHQAYQEDFDQEMTLIHRQLEQQNEEKRAQIDSEMASFAVD